MMDEKWSVCRAMAWIAFRRQDFLTDDPDELRANMKRHKKLLRVKNPARELLNGARSGALNVMKRPILPGTMQGAAKMSPIEWMQISEADIWRKAEFEWKYAQGEIKLEVRLIPTMSMKMVADDGREFEDMGPAFAQWSDATLSDEEQIEKIYKTGKLNAELSLSFWQWLGRTDTVPDELRLYLDRDEFDDFVSKQLPKR